eukprot:CAMPEP_0171194030 /NCGR_PEP_ID=MMETSP0790-20130122/20682_1 /TAXON_ID=2925 /ORGANISM="Alexandrium catenella, Strain OF101" /LENGTH=327 /DNA_ID=CAMNT_0011659221 /DNA_START=262 /DNA_END=1242 /DNA_ORIENTATION=+
MVLSLVVQVAVEEVDDVIPGMVGRAAENRAEVEFRGLRLAGPVEPPQVTACMVCDDRAERVYVRDDLRTQQVCKGVPTEGQTQQPAASPQEPRQEWQHQEVHGDGRAHDTEDEVRGKGPVPRTAAHDPREEASQGQGGLQGRLGGCMLLLGVQQLQGVGGVVVPLPDGHEDHSEEVLHREGQVEGLYGRRVPLDKVRVGILIQGVVVDLVVLEDPRRGEDPVQPVQHPAAEALRIPAAARAPKAAVQGVVRQNGELGVLVVGEAEHAEGAHGALRGQRHTDEPQGAGEVPERRKVAPLLCLRGLRCIPRRAEVVRERLGVEGRDLLG